MFRTLLALSLPAALLVAQAGPEAEHPRSEAGERPGRARIAARLHAIRSRLIMNSLGVPETLARSVADRWGQFDFESHDRRQAMRAARQKVQEILMGPGSEEEKNIKVLPAMNQFSGLQKQQKEAKQKFEEDLQRMLTPVQQGRFIILMDEFQRKLLEAMPENRR
jgi:hypothetical protein